MYAPFSTYEGRYSNGPVAVEYMVQSDISPALPQGSAGVKLVDCELFVACSIVKMCSPDLKDDAVPADAFGGSVIQNGLDGTGTAYPAAENQARPRSDSSSRRKRSKRADEVRDCRWRTTSQI